MKSVYTDAVTRMVWSFSRLSTFNQCKYEFYLKYILNDESEYQSEGNYYAEVGSFVHGILEKIFTGKLDVEDAPNYYMNHFDEEVCYKTKQEQMDKAYEDCANYFSELDLSRLEQYDVLGVEKKIQTEIEGYPLIGFIDLLLKDKTTGELVLVDHKSGKSPISKKTGKPLKAQEASFDGYKKQLYLYSKAVIDEYGKPPKWLVWNHFREGMIVKIPFEQKEYESALKWMVNTVRSIEQEQDFAETQEYFYCHQLCPYRGTCEYVNTYWYGEEDGG